MIIDSKNGTPVQVFVETWPPMFAHGVLYHAIISIRTTNGHEYRRHETARFPERADAENAAWALLAKRGYRTRTEPTSVPAAPKAP